MINSQFFSVSSMNTLRAILKVTDERRDVILTGVLNHRFPWRHLPLAPWLQLTCIIFMSDTHGGRGGGGGGYSTLFYMPLCIIFVQKGTPFVYLPLKNVASPTYQLTVFFSLYEPFNKLKRYSSKVCVQNSLNT